jgi:hypothetical protein
LNQLIVVFALVIYLGRVNALSAGEGLMLSFDRFIFIHEVLYVAALEFDNDTGNLWVGAFSDDNP